MPRSDTEDTDLRTALFPCYLELLGCSCWGARLLIPCYLELLGRSCCEPDCGDESADGAATMLFGAVGAAAGERACGDESVRAQLLGSETAETNLRTVLLPCYLELLGCSCSGARLRR